MPVKFYDASGYLDRVKSSGLPTFVGNYAAYARLFLGEVMPDFQGKILYLDSDTLVTGDISGFYDADIEGKLCLGIQDVVPEEYCMKNGFSRNYVYINSGIILINLQEWRKCFTNDGIRELSAGLVLDMPDQDIINAALFRAGTESYTVPLRYNVLTPYFEWNFESLKIAYPKTKGRFYSRNEIEEAVKNPAIIHMVDGMNGRPWHKGNSNPLSDKWESILKETEFYEDFKPIEPEPKSWRRRLKLWIYKTFPNVVTATIILLYVKLKYIVKGGKN